MHVANFDESKVNWQRLPDLDHLWPSILDVGETAKVVDVLFKFAANQKIVLHRHVAASHTFVVQSVPIRQVNPMRNLTQSVVATRTW